MGLYQEFAGREHTPSGTTIETDIHGKVAKFISIGDLGDVVERKGVKTLGNTYESAWGAPDGSLKTVDIKMRMSGLPAFEQALRDAYGVPAGISLAQRDCKMVITVKHEAIDGDEQALPPVVRQFKCLYLGSESGADRGNNDPIVATLKVQMTTPALVLP